MTDRTAAPPGEYLILLYHGIHATDLELGLRNSSGKHISQARFSDEMRQLKMQRPIVSMADIAAAHRGEAVLPAGAVAVTFDDGFRNNFNVAWPVLGEIGVPATFYLASGYIGTGRKMWTDRLEVSIVNTARRRLDLEVEGLIFRYEMKDDAARMAAFNDIRLRCKTVSNARKDRIVAAIEAELGGGIDDGDPLATFMSWDEARQMDSSPLVTFGAHTVDHVSLAKVSEGEMRRQVDESVAKLTCELGHPCDFFSYPEGLKDDYNATVVSHLRDRGFDHCPTAIAGINRLDTTNPFEIGRCMVGMEGRPFPIG